MNSEPNEKPDAPTQHYNSWLVVALLLALSTASYLDRNLISLVVDQIRADLQLTDIDLGLLQGLAFGLFYAAFGIPAGWLVDRFPRQRVLAAGFSVWTIATIGCGLARNVTQLFVSRFAVGAGEAVLSPAAYSVLSDLFKKNRLAFVLSIYASGSTMGAALAFLLGGAVVAYATARGVAHIPLIGIVQPWQQAFLVVSLPTLPLLFVLLLMRDPGRRGPKTDDHATWSELLKFIGEHRTNISCHFLGFGMLAILGYGYAAWTPAFFMRHYHADVADVGWWLGITNIVAGVPGLFFTGLAVDWMYGRGYKDAHFRYFLFSAPVLALVAMIGFYWAQSVVVSLICLGLIYFLIPFGGAAPAHLQIITPVRLRGRISALYVLVYSFMGLALGPSLIAITNSLVFDDPAKIGKAIGLCFLVIGLLVTALFTFNLRFARLSVEMAGT